VHPPVLPQPFDLERVGAAPYQAARGREFQEAAFILLLFDCLSVCLLVNRRKMDDLCIDIQILECILFHRFHVYFISFTG
jgi:hypothetical protein